MTNTLEIFGYTQTEAAFLQLVVRTGGYFVRRQFNQFADCQRGKRTHDFVQKLLSRGHGRLTVNRHSRQVIHIQFRRFYQALDCDDNRFRREHQTRAIKARIMSLDFAIANPATRLLTAQHDKIRWLVTQTGIPKDDIGGRLDNLAIALQCSQPSPTVSFLYIDDGASTLANFHTVLRRSAPVIRPLGAFEFIYAAEHSVFFPKAEALFRSIVLGLGTRRRPDVERLLHFFTELNRYESRQTTDFDKRRLDQLRDLRDEFSAPGHIALYHVWREDGERAVRAKLQPDSAPAAQCGASFRSLLLEHDYAIFENFRIAS